MIAAAYRAAWAVEREPDIAAQVVRTNEADAAPASAVNPATLRKRRSRAKQKKVDGQIEMFPATIASSCDTERDTACDERDIKRDRSQRQKEVPRTLRKTTSLRSVVGGGGDARASPISISPEAFAVAAQVSLVARIDPDPEATLPGWCGAPMWAQGKLNAGIPEAVIVAGARAGMASMPRGSPDTPFYFDKPIARLVAQTTRPQLVVATSEPNHAQVSPNRSARSWQSRRDDWHAALDELHEHVVGFSAGSG